VLVPRDLADLREAIARILIIVRVLGFHASLLGEPEAGVKALDEGVLLGLARGDVAPLDAGSVCPVEDGSRGELGAVVADHHRGSPPDGDERVEFPRDGGARNRLIARLDVLARDEDLQQRLASSNEWDLYQLALIGTHAPSRGDQCL
jgi:hypothetical protein